jgi:transposase
MNYPLSEQKRWSIVSLLKHTSLSQRQIARQLKCHYNTVHNIATLYHSTNKIDQRPRSGRPKKLNMAKRISFRLTLRKHPTATTSELQKFLQKQHNIIVSPSTIKRTRRSLHFHPATEIIQPKLTVAHKKKRVEFAKSHLEENWKLVLFSDEKLFSLNATRNRVWIEEGTPIPVREVQQNNYSVMVWGAIWYARSFYSINNYWFHQL